jgi:hypothetical protein
LIVLESGRLSSWAWLAGFLAVAAVGLPVQAVARWIAASGGLTGPLIPQGLWWFKLGLLVLSGLVWWSGRGLAERDVGFGPGPSDAPEPLPGGGRLLVAILAVALVLRLVDLGSGLWLDEIKTVVEYVRRPIVAIVTDYASDNNHLLFSVLVRITMSVLGESAFSLRLPAVLMGVASIWAAFAFAVRVGSRREGLLVAAFLALSFHHVWFSQNGRGYTGLMLFTILSSSALLDVAREVDERAARRAAFRYALFASLGAYVHLTGVFAMAAQGLVGLALLVSRRARHARWVLVALLGAGVITFTMYAPVLPQLLQSLLGAKVSGPQSEWQGVGWFVAELLSGLARGLPGGWLALAVGGAVGLFGIVGIVRRTPAAAALMVLPGILGLVVLLATGRNLWPRFFFFLGGFAVLIAVRGVGDAFRVALGPRGDKAAAVALTNAALVSGLLVPRAWGPKQDYRAAIQHVSQMSSPGEAVVVTGLAAFPYRQYYGMPWPAVESLADLRAVEAVHSRVRIVLTFPIQIEAAQPELHAYLQEHYEEAAAYPGTVGSGEVFVLTRSLR